MRKKEERTSIYPEYAKKYNGYNINVNRLKMIENICVKTYNIEMGLNLDGYIRMNLYFEALSQLYKDIEYLDAINRYKGIVVGHSDDIKKYLSKEEIDIIFDDTIDQMKDNYDHTEAVGSYIVRNFKNNLVEYTNETYNTNFNKLDDNECKIKLLKK